MCDGVVTPFQLEKELFDYKNVGSLIYKRSKSNNAESMKVCQLTVMQLIAANMIKVEVNANGNKPIAHCKLVFDNESLNSPTYIQPHYLIDRHWSKITTL